MLSFAACNKDGAKSVNDDDSKVWYLNDHKTDVQAIFDGVKDTVSPDDIFSSVKYTDELLYGAYAINDLEKDVKKYKKSLSFRDAEFDNGTFNISTLPIAVYSGAEYLPNAEFQYRKVTDREVAALKFIAGDKIGTVPCTYEINGNKVEYTALTETTENGEFSYEFDQEVFEYEFSLIGPYLTLTDGKDSIQLTAYSFTDNNKSTTAM